MLHQFSRIRYQTTTFSITLTAFFLGLTLLVSFLSSSYIPSIPLLNGRIDFWYGFLFASIIFIPKWQFKIFYLISLNILIYFIDGVSYFGIGDYIIEFSIPTFSTLLLVFFDFSKSKKRKFFFLLFSVIVFSLIRLFFVTLGGAIFYEVTWLSSLILNSLNIVVDGLAILFLLPLLIILLQRVIKKANVISK